ncbi:hypothetical protein [Rhodococcoides fascians]|uniref:hypothetical protein n=1 Tax=Rhodococcoides fascians TaxID=1828 RepID=UPI0012FD801D|nr:hypothetical protein [Rhodococcus fascians]
MTQLDLFDQSVGGGDELPPARWCFVCEKRQRPPAGICGPACIPTNQEDEN